MTYNVVDQQSVSLGTTRNHHLRRTGSASPLHVLPIHIPLHINHSCGATNKRMRLFIFIIYSVTVGWHCIIRNRNISFTLHCVSIDTWFSDCRVWYMCLFIRVCVCVYVRERGQNRCRARCCYSRKLRSSKKLLCIVKQYKLWSCNQQWKKKSRSETKPSWADEISVAPVVWS